MRGGLPGLARLRAAHRIVYRMRRLIGDYERDQDFQELNDGFDLERAGKAGAGKKAKNVARHGLVIGEITDPIGDGGLNSADVEGLETRDRSFDLGAVIASCRLPRSPAPAIAGSKTTALRCGGSRRRATRARSYRVLRLHDLGIGVGERL
jgi:hypothetical protein